jgi:PAS domain-containing protein
LALEVGVTQRHLSFVESGRAKPGEDLVVRLSELLGLALRDRNALLIAAGYAPRFGEADWASPALSSIRDAARLILESHEPHPAFVLDVDTTVLDANRPALALVGASASDLGRLNLVDLVFGPGPVRAAIVNWEEVATYLLGRLREAVRWRGSGSRVRPVYERALRLAGASLPTLPAPAAPLAVLPLSFRVGSETLHWFTTVTTFGAPQDALVEEITIELFHPLSVRAS